MRARGREAIMSVRKEIRRRKDGSARVLFIVDVKVKRPDGEVVRVRKVSPVATQRAALAYERELRELLLGHRPPPAQGPAPAHDPAAPALAPPTARAPTLRDFVPEFMRYQASPGASRRGANKPGELREKQRIFDNHLLPAFGDLPLDQLNARRIDGYIAAKSAPPPALVAPERPRRSRPGEPLAAATVANHIILLRRVLTVAHRWDLIDRVPPIQCPAPSRARTDFLTFDEADRFLAAAPAAWRLLLLLAIRTGLRLGELRALRWSDLHLDAGYLRVEQNLTTAGLGTPKSGRSRTVDLAPDLREALRRQSGAPGPHALVFTQPDGAPLSQGQIYRAVRRTAARAQLGRPVHPHLLRHTFASHCVMRGIPLAVVKEWLGHAESRMTERYAHLAPEVRAGYIERLGGGPSVGDPRPQSRSTRG